MARGCQPEFLQNLTFDILQVQRCPNGRGINPGHGDHERRCFGLPKRLHGVNDHLAVQALGQRRGGGPILKCPAQAVNRYCQRNTHFLGTVRREPDNVGFQQRGLGASVDLVQPTMPSLSGSRQAVICAFGLKLDTCLRLGFDQYGDGLGALLAIGPVQRLVAGDGQMGHDAQRQLGVSSQGAAQAQHEVAVGGIAQQGVDT